MKRLWIALVTLGLLFAISLGHAAYLKHFTQGLINQLSQAEDAVDQGDWETARQLTDQAFAQWEGHSFYLHTTLHHSDVDDIYISFHEVQEYVETEKKGEYSAANGILMAELYLLYEMEQFNLQNLL